MIKHMIYTGSVRVLENMVLRLLDKLAAKDIREGGLSSRSLASALAEMHKLGEKLICTSTACCKKQQAVEAEIQKQQQAGEEHIKACKAVRH